MQSSTGFGVGTNESLWNVGYDSILRLRLPIGCSVTCYADLLVACADSFEEARVKAEVGATFVIRSIERLGLRVSIAKTEAAAFSAKGVPALLFGLGRWFRLGLP